MTKAELKKQRNSIYAKANEACRALEIQYALEHNPIKIGDVIAHTHFPELKIRVQKIEVPDFGKFMTPECSYIGTVIGYDSDIEYIDKTESLFQSRVDEINGQPYKFIPE